MSQYKGSSASNVVALRAPDTGSLRFAWDSFVLDRRVSGASDATLSCYRYQVVPFIRWCDANGVDFAELSASHVKSYLALRQQRSHNALCEAALRIRTFLRWCSSQGMCGDSVTQVQVPRRETKVLPILTVVHLKTMLALSRDDTFVARRNDALIRLLVDTGVRVSEALSLSANDLAMGEFQVIVRGKGNKQRCVFFGVRTARSLVRYLRRRRTIVSASQALFINQNGLPVTRRHAHQLLARLGRRAGIDGVRVSPHTLRHTFATLFLQRGGDSLLLQRLLGHTTLAMTRRYVALRTDDLLSAHRRAGVGDLL
jgi:site-specific recombinase XerD